MAAQRRGRGRIRAGWRIGLAQGDSVIRIGTLIVLVQLGLIGYLFWKV